MTPFDRSFEMQMTAQVGRNLRSIREAHGLSQQTLAAMLDISFQQVQKYELGKNRISVEKLTYLSKQLNVPLDVFVADMPLPTTNPARKPHRLWSRAQQSVSAGVR